MTHRRMPGSVEAALIQTLHELSEAEVRRATGKGLSTFYRASNPQLDAGLHLADAAALDAALIAKGQAPRLLSIGRRLKQEVLAELGGATPHQPLHPLERLAGVMGELGDVAGEVRAASCGSSTLGRSIDEREAARILAEIEDAEAELTKLKADIHAAIVRRPRVVA